jgi:hypothetical protein
MRRAVFALSSLLVGLGFAAQALALSLEDISSTDATGGLRQALTQGASAAVANLGKTDGFLGNPKVKIPLPEGLRQAESVMRKMGMGKQADELVTAMNRAAEAAVAESKPILVDAVKKMSVQDAKQILTGGDDSVTQYFRRATSEPLTQKFKPIVSKATKKVKLADKYDRYAGQAAQLGLVKSEDAKVENYVTRKALDGLFAMIAEEERAIRKDPLGATGALAKKVFGALGN